MIRIEEQMKKLAVLTGVMLVAAAEAMAQDNLAKPARRIVVSIPDRKMAVLEGEKVVKVYATAVGAPASPSPTGSFTIVNQIEDPTWYTKGRTVPPGKANPLGTRWMGLSKKGYGIHGTNVPSMAASGCATAMSRSSSRSWRWAIAWSWWASAPRSWTGSSPPIPWWRSRAPGRRPADSKGSGAWITFWVVC